MSTVSEKQILNALHSLEVTKWMDVLTYIIQLRQETRLDLSNEPTRVMTAEDLLRSPLVGLWADRTDIADASAFARQLREQAEHRH